MLIISQGFVNGLKTKLRMFVGRCVSVAYHAFIVYESFFHPNYNFKERRLGANGINRVNQYVKEKVDRYKYEQQDAVDIEKLSEYYPYKKIEEQKDSKPLVKICNVGCFYCGADYAFLKKHPDSVVYGLDFGDIIKINQDLLVLDNLKLFPGYPLETLENFAKITNNEYMFDYTIFTRTATLINIEQLLSYMECIQKLSKNIIFLEVAKLTTYTSSKLDVYNIDLMNPVRMYAGMYIHNYPQLLQKFSYEIVTEEILHYNAFKQLFDPDHDFIYIHGRKKG